MRDSLLKFFAAREEKVVMAGETYFVRTKPDDAEPLKDGEDYTYQFLVRSTFDAEGKPAFTDEDIPALKAAPHILKARLLRAVAIVNGFDAETETKNSEAAPSFG